MIILLCIAIPSFKLLFYQLNTPPADLTVKATGDLDVNALKGALEETLRRHEALRTSFVIVDGRPVQVVAPNTLPNYEGEVLKLTAGCAVEATGVIVPSP